MSDLFTLAEIRRLIEAAKVSTMDAQCMALEHLDDVAEIDAAMQAAFSKLDEVWCKIAVAQREARHRHAAKQEKAVA